MLFQNRHPVSIYQPLRLPLKIVVDYEPGSSFSMTTRDRIYHLCKFADILKERDIVVNVLMSLPKNSSGCTYADLKIGLCASRQGNTSVNISSYGPETEYFPLICLGVEDYDMADRDKRYDVMAYLFMHEIGHVIGHLAYHNDIYSDEDDISEYTNVWMRKSERFADAVALDFFDDLDKFKEVMRILYQERKKIEAVDRVIEFRNRSSQFDGSWRPRLKRIALKYA